MTDPKPEPRTEIPTRVVAVQDLRWLVALAEGVLRRKPTPAETRRIQRIKRLAE